MFRFCLFHSPMARGVVQAIQQQQFRRLSQLPVGLPIHRASTFGLGLGLATLTVDSGTESLAGGTSARGGATNLDMAESGEGGVRSDDLSDEYQRTYYQVGVG